MTALLRNPDAGSAAGFGLLGTSTSDALRSQVASGPCGAFTWLENSDLATSMLVAQALVYLSVLMAVVCHVSQ